MIRPVAWAAAALLAAAVAAATPSAYEAMKIRPSEVLTGTVVAANVLPGGDKQTVALVTYLTGRKDEAGAVNVRLAVFRRDGDTLIEAYARDYGEENGGHVGRAELELVDLNGDDMKEVVVSFEDFRDKLVSQRRTEVVTWERGTARVVWTGTTAYDATRAARGVPPERRDAYTRRLDTTASLRSRGESVVFEKKMTAVAGERLAEPRVTREAFAWRPEGQDR
jgi:hypothetical protein